MSTKNKFNLKFDLDLKMKSIFFLYSLKGTHYMHIQCVFIAYRRKYNLLLGGVVVLLIERTEHDQTKSRTLGKLTQHVTLVLFSFYPVSCSNECVTNKRWKTYF